MRGRMTALIIAAALLLIGTALATASDVGSVTSAMGAAALAIESVEYEGNGVVEVDFARDVRLESPAVAIEDALGAPVTAAVLDADDDSLRFRADNLIPGATYNFTISGANVTEPAAGSFTVPEDSALRIQSIDVDLADREIDIEFPGRVRFVNPAVTVRGADGSILQSRILSTDDDGVDVRVDGLIPGATYTAEVTGVSLPDGQPTAVSGEFTAIDD